MRITNKLGLPEAFRKACEVKHRQGDYSVTQLLKPAQEIALSIMLDSVLEDDCADRFWAVFGTAVHKVFEGEKEAGVLNEAFLEADIDGHKVTGQADIVDFNENIIKDYKTCSVWKFRLPDSDFSDWENQLRAYCYLWNKAHENCWENNIYYIDRGQIIAILRDWSQTEAERDKEYPQSPVQVVNFSFTPEQLEAVAEEWSQKISDVEFLIGQCMKNGIKEMGFCPDKDTWTTQTTWAVMKEGRKSAVRVFDNKEQAEELAGTDKTYSVQERKGEHKKCERYCIIAKNGFCRGCKK